MRHVGSQDRINVWRRLKFYSGLHTRVPLSVANLFGRFIGLNEIKSGIIIIFRRDNSLNVISLSILSYFPNICSSYTWHGKLTSYFFKRNFCMTQSVRRSSVFRMSLVFLSFVSRTHRLLRLQRFLIYAAIGSIYTTLSHPALISALGYLSPISILQLYSRSSSLSNRLSISLAHGFI